MQLADIVLNCGLSCVLNDISGSSLGPTNGGSDSERYHRLSSSTDELHVFRASYSE